MGVSTPVAAKANGLSTVVDTVAAPHDAFERIAAAPTWGWALVIALVLMLAGTYIQGPVMQHIRVESTQAFLNNSSLAANMTDAQKQKALENASKPSVFTYVSPVIGLFIAVFFNTLVLLIGNAVGRGQADFKRLWCGSMNIAVPTLGIGTLVLAAIMVIRGPNAFHGGLAIAKAMPSLALVAPNAGPVLLGFLSGITIFTLWGFFLNATMMRVTAKTSPAIAYTFSAIVLLLGALFGAVGAAVAHGFGMA